MRLNYLPNLNLDDVIDNHIRIASRREVINYDEVSCFKAVDLKFGPSKAVPRRKPLYPRYKFIIHTIIERCSNDKDGVEYIACIQKGTEQGGCPPCVPDSVAGCSTVETPQGKTIIVFDGEMNKVLASFIIANGALAMGRPVTMFFTFWGLTALRKTDRRPIKKKFIEKCSTELRSIMKDKNIDSLEELMKKAMDAGVKIIACSMSMDVMGIREEELIDGVEIGGVGTYLGEAEESNVNLFV